MPLLRRGSLTAPARRNTIAADQEGRVNGEDRLLSVPQEGRGFGLDGDGVRGAEAEGDFKYRLEGLEPPKRRRETERVLVSGVRGGGG